MTAFIQQTLVFIGSAILLVPIFQRLRFGSVLGYLIAGMLVGPYGLKLIPDSEAVIHFSELGVILLLFLIGIEIQPARLWSMRTQLLGLGGLQVGSSFFVFTLIGWLSGLHPTTAAVIGFGLSLSSTAFALQTLTERHQFNTDFGRSSFSILLMQDLTAIPALAVIPVLAANEKSRLLTVGGAVEVFAVIAFLLFASRFLIRPVFRAIASTRTNEIFTAATLFVVLGVAALMQSVGLSAALGAFVAGVLLADSEYRHELEANLNPFKSLLMGLFFIGVGMSVSIDLIIARPVFIFGLAVGYSVIKGCLIYFSARAFGLRSESAKMTALTIAQGGEFAFVIFGMALQLGIAPAESVALLTAVITLSMALSPISSVLNDFIAKFKKLPAPEYDEINGEEPQVIIAGFGRFGQIFGRILRAQSIPFVAIDHDPDQIELLRRFGNKVYYGDASRLDLLEAAGAAKAKFLVLAIDDVEASLDAARVVREHFPNLKIFARARNRGHAFDLMDLGISAIKRETFDASVYFVRDLLLAMGFSPERAQAVIERFKKHDEIMLAKQFKVRHDDKEFVSLAKQGTAQLSEVLSEDSIQSYIDAAPR